MEAASTAPEARRFGKYTLVAKLATGGMAEIFLARLHGDGGFEKLVCIKRILPHLAKDPQFVAMFLDEARVAARISHPNVCQVFELGEWHGQYYIAMEYLEGVPLSVFRRKDFYALLPDPRLVAAFGVQACEGLHHAHQLKRPDGELLGVVHRDVSPQNLFATTDGIVKVLDFGIAKVQDASVRTSTGAVKGTYAYMAPEQLRNEKLDRRTDVWAIGVVLWETLAQRHLFKRETEFLTFEAITKLPIPHISEVRPDVPALLGDTIARALSRNPDDRFPSARALGEALAQAVGPLGGVLGSAAISDEVTRSFEASLAEQRMLLRIAREGGQFDLDRSSPLGPHGTAASQTPVSNIQRRVEEARAEVAHFVAATQAIDSLESDESAIRRFPSDGAFTPAPSRRSAAQEAQRPDTYDPEAEATYDEGLEKRQQAQRRSSPHAAQPERRSQSYAAQERRSQPHPSQRTSGPYNVAPAEWRYDETEPPLPVRQTSSIPAAPVRRSRLPWIVMMIAIAAAGGTAVMLYLELNTMKKKGAAAEEKPETAVVMKSEPTTAVDEAKPDPDTIKPEGETAEEAKVTKVEANGKAETKVEANEKAETTVDKTVPTDPKPDKVTKIEKAPRTDTKVAKTDPRVAKTDPKVAKADPKVKTDTRVKSDKTDKVEVKVEPKAQVPAGPPGFITIDSTPVYAVIYIDGKKHGETPLVNIKLAPGKHSVRAVSPSGSTRTLSINIESGKTAPVRRIEW